MLHNAPEVPLFHQGEHNSMSKIKTTNELNLIRTLSLIEYERTMRMRELEIKRRQFLHGRHDAQQNDSSTIQLSIQRREDLRKRIQREKDAETRCQNLLLQRKDELMEKIKSTMMSQKMRTSKKNLFNFEQSIPEENVATDVKVSGLSDYKLNNTSNRVVDLYQKGFDLIKRKKETNRNPFIESVDKILQKLRAQDENPDQNDDPFSLLSKSVLKKYAADEDSTVTSYTVNENNADTGTSSDQVELKEHSTTPSTNNDAECILNKDSNGKGQANEDKSQKGNNKIKEPPRYSSKALNLWARVRREQKAVSRLTRSNHLARHDITTDDSSNFPPKNHQEKAFSNSTRDESIGYRDSFSQQESIKSKGITNGNHDRKSKIRSPSLETPSKNSCLNPKSEKMMIVPTLNIETSSDVSENEGKCLAQECIEECDETSTPHTIIIVHKDNEDVTPPLRWDQGYRYSFSQSDNEILTSSSFLESPVKTDQDNKHPSGIDEKTSKIDQSTAMNSLDLNQISTDIEETPISQQKDLAASVISLDNLSDTASGRRSVSRQGGGEFSGKRRLSMQTRGSLRALAGVMKEDNRREAQMQEENIHPESSTYKAIFEVLAGAAANADEQSQRLSDVRRAGLGLASQTINMKDNKHLVGIKDHKGRNVQNVYYSRRNTIDTSRGSSSADVTDPVYKFLQRRTQSKTMRRHKTLSNVELKLLAHAPGEDITGRRHSFSSQQSRRSSSSLISMDSLRRLSVSSSPRKQSSDLSIVVESESSQSRRNSARIGSGSTRPHSVALSDIDNTERSGLQVIKESRSYSWAPDVSETGEWHVLAMELLARNSGKGVSRFRTVNHMLQWLGEEYRRQTSDMMYEELRYCTYLRLPKHQLPVELTESEIDISTSGSGTSSPN